MIITQDWINLGLVKKSEIPASYNFDWYKMPQENATGNFSADIVKCLSLSSLLLDEQKKDEGLCWLAVCASIIQKKCWEGHERVNNTHFPVSGWSQHLKKREEVMNHR